MFLCYLNRFAYTVIVLAYMWTLDIEGLLQDELIRQHGIKYTLVLTAELEQLRLSDGQCMTITQSQM